MAAPALGSTLSWATIRAGGKLLERLDGLARLGDAPEVAVGVEVEGVRRARRRRGAGAGAGIAWVGFLHPRRGRVLGSSSIRIAKRGAGRRAPPGVGAVAASGLPDAGQPFQADVDARQSRQNGRARLWPSRRYRERSGNGSDRFPVSLAKREGEAPAEPTIPGKVRIRIGQIPHVVGETGGRGSGRADDTGKGPHTDRTDSPCRWLGRSLALPFRLRPAVFACAQVAGGVSGAGAAGGASAGGAGSAGGASATGAGATGAGAGTSGAGAFFCLAGLSPGLTSSR